MQRQAKHTAIPGTPAPAIAAMNKITIALLHGYTVGTGLLMSLACDIRIAAEGARLGVSEVRLGFMAGSGGTQRMPRLVGIPKRWRFVFPANFTMPRSVTASAW